MGEADFQGHSPPRTYGTAFMGGKKRIRGLEVWGNSEGNIWGEITTKEGSRGHPANHWPRDCKS